MNDNHFQIRHRVERSDIETVRRLCALAGNFSSEEIELAGELVEERLRRDLASGYHFAFVQNGSTVAGFICFGPIPCTRDGWDVYWIAVHPDFQGWGIGRKLLEAAEERIQEDGGGRIYIDTSSRPSYRKARCFYQAAGYRLEACLNDFYSPGDDKCVFVKIFKDNGRMVENHRSRPTGA